MALPSSAPQAVYFDSNILRQAGWPKPSVRLLEIINLARELGVEPSLVDLVRREVMAGWIRDLGMERNALLEKTRGYNRRALGVVQASEPDPLPADQEIREQLARMTADFENQFRLVPTTRQPTSTFVDLALSRGGAFSEGGKGFSDTLILVSIIEDMTAHGISHALLVSEDKGFRGDGLRQITGDRHLRIVKSIQELQTLLDTLVTAHIHAMIEANKQRVFDAVQRAEPQLQEFLIQQLPTLAEKLQSIDQIRKIEFLGIAEFEDAHAIPFTTGQEHREENRFSVDIRIKARIETMSFLFEQKLRKIDASPLSFHPEDFLISTDDQEIVVTVEGAAEMDGAGIKTVVFSGLSLKTEGRGFTGLLAQSGP